MASPLLDAVHTLPQRRKLKWLFLVLAVCVTAPVSLFVHDYMLETLKVPYPRFVGVPNWVKFVNEVVRLFTLAALCRMARPKLRGVSKIKASLAVGLLFVMLYETLRVFFIEAAIMNSFVYSAYSRAPQAISLFIGGAAVTWIVLSDLKREYTAALIVAIAALLTFLIYPPLDKVFASLKDGMPGVKDLYADPYPFKINVIIYVAFLEPTIAAFVAASYCWHALTGSLVRRTLTFATLLLLVRSRFTQLLLQSFWIKLPRHTAMFAVSQFFLETFVLAVLAALAWNYVEQIAPEEL